MGVLFPFGIATLALLGNQVFLIVSFISSLVDVRRQKWRSEYAKRAEQKFGHDGERPSDLQQEVNYLSNVYQKEERMSQMFDLVGSLIPFLLFWLIGAIVYAAFEGWTYGNSVYFSYVFFMTFGYGDFTPKSAGGRSFFVLHSLCGVPILSFALGVITNMVSAVSDPGFDGDKLKDEHGNGVTETHASLIDEEHRNIDQKLGERSQNDTDPVDRAVKDSGSPERFLLEKMIAAGCSLEAQARRIMMNQLPEGSAPQTILRADRNQQLRDMRALGVDQKALNDIMSEEADSDGDLLQQTVEYRKTFAAFLASAARLRELHGWSQKAFERRRDSDEDDQTVGDSGDLSGFVDAQEKEKGVGGKGDNLQPSGEEQKASEEQEHGQTGPATGLEKAMNASQV